MIKFDKLVYSVWVGGGEINDHHIYDHRTAQELADEYRSQGYDDVEITFSWQPHAETETWQPHTEVEK